MSKTPIKPGTSKLNAAERKKLYIEAYIKTGGNKRQAGLAAGASSDVAADKYANRLSKDVKVMEELLRRQQEVLAKAEIDTGISVARTLREVGRLGYVDLAKCFDEHGNALEMHEIPEDTRAAIAGFEMEELFVGKGEDRTHVGSVKKFKFHDKNSALDKLMKHFGLYERDNAQQPAALPPSFILVPVRAAG